MFFIKLFNILKGYVIITVKGLFLERFLNICTRRAISLWNIKRSGKTEMTAAILVSDFKKLKPVAKKSYSKVHIKSKVGLPFFLYRHKKRKAMLIGAVSAFVVLFWLSRYIWVVDITGNERISLATLENELSLAGVKSGVLLKSINIKSVQNQLMTNIPELSWIGINLKGTTAIIDVKERNIVPDAFPKNEPCSIIAKKSGVIERADVKEGNRLIKPGDVVQKGQILVSGILEGELAETRYVHSDGEIIARTWHEKSVELPQYKEVRTPTGKEKSMHSLKIHNFCVKLYLSDRISFENYDRISNIKKLSLGNGFVLPVSFNYDKYIEQNVKQVEMSVEEIVNKLYSEMDKELSGIEIVNKQHILEGNKLTVTYECLENIIEKVGF